MPSQSVKEVKEKKENTIVQKNAFFYISCFCYWFQTKKQGAHNSKRDHECPSTCLGRIIVYRQKQYTIGLMLCLNLQIWHKRAIYVLSFVSLRYFNTFPKLVFVRYNWKKNQFTSSRVKRNNSKMNFYKEMLKNLVLYSILVERKQVEWHHFYFLFSISIS